MNHTFGLALALIVAASACFQAHLWMLGAGCALTGVILLIVSGTDRRFR